MSIILDILADDEKLTKLSKIIFESVDTDGSGQIDINELKKALKDSDEDTSDPDLETKIEQALEILDSDGSGTIDIYEFKELVRQLLEAFNN